MEDNLESLISELPQTSKKTGEPTAIAIPGWKHDLIEEKLRSRGVVFKNTQESGSEIAQGRNKEGRWVIETQRLSPTPHSILLFDPKPHPKW
ncbi:hypothetical protein EBZ39_11870 [bacterium]|nr:hypothetical protein [bacterium]